MKLTLNPLEKRSDSDEAEQKTVAIIQLDEWQHGHGWIGWGDEKAPRAFSGDSSLLHKAYVAI
jgi:hypothetical protein